MVTDKTTSIILSDVDNVFTSYINLQNEFENPNGRYSDYDIIFSYGTNYPSDIFETMGLTVCGGLSYWRASNKQSNINFLYYLIINKCNCHVDLEHTNVCDKSCSCDDQIEINNMIVKGYGHNFQITWDDPPRMNPKNQVLPWASKKGIIKFTNSKVLVWSRHVAYRGPPPKDKSKCPLTNWAFHPYSATNKVKAMKEWFDTNCGYIELPKA